MPVLKVGDPIGFLCSHPKCAGKIYSGSLLDQQHGHGLVHCSAISSRGAWGPVNKQANKAMLLQLDLAVEPAGNICGHLQPPLTQKYPVVSKMQIQPPYPDQQELSPEEYQKLPVGHLVLLKLASEPAGVRVVGVTDRLSGTIRVRHLYTGVLVPEADIMSLSAGYPRYNDTQDSWWTMRAAPEQAQPYEQQHMQARLPPSAYPTSAGPGIVYVRRQADVAEYEEFQVVGEPAEGLPLDIIIPNGAPDGDHDCIISIKGSSSRLFRGDPSQLVRWPPDSKTWVLRSSLADGAGSSGGHHQQQERLASLLMQQGGSDTRLPPPPAPPPPQQQQEEEEVGRGPQRSAVPDGKDPLAGQQSEEGAVASAVQPAGTGKSEASPLTEQPQQQQSGKQPPPPLLEGNPPFQQLIALLDSSDDDASEQPQQSRDRLQPRGSTLQQQQQRQHSAPGKRGSHVVDLTGVDKEGTGHHHHQQQQQQQQPLRVAHSNGLAAGLASAGGQESPSKRLRMAKLGAVTTSIASPPTSSHANTGGAAGGMRGQGRSSPPPSPAQDGQGQQHQQQQVAAGVGAAGAGAMARSGAAAGKEELLIATVLTAADAQLGCCSLSRDAFRGPLRLAMESMQGEDSMQGVGGILRLGVKDASGTVRPLFLGPSADSTPQRPSYLLHWSKDLLPEGPLGQGTAVAVFRCPDGTHRIEFGTQGAEDALAEPGGRHVESALAAAAAMQAERIIAAATATARGGAATQRLPRNLSSSAALAASRTGLYPGGLASPAAAAATPVGVSTHPQLQLQHQQGEQEWQQGGSLLPASGTSTSRVLQLSQLPQQGFNSPGSKRRSGLIYLPDESDDEEPPYQQQLQQAPYRTGVAQGYGAAGGMPSPPKRTCLGQPGPPAAASSASPASIIRHAGTGVAAGGMQGQGRCSTPPQHGQGQQRQQQVPVDVGAAGAAATGGTPGPADTEEVVIAKVLLSTDTIADCFYLPASTVGFVPRVAVHSAQEQCSNIAAKGPNGRDCRLVLRLMASGSSRVPGYTLHGTYGLLGRPCGGVQLGQGVAFAVLGSNGGSKFRLEWGTELAASAVSLLSSKLVPIDGAMVSASGREAAAAVARIAAERLAAADAAGANMPPAPLSSASSALLAASRVYVTPGAPAAAAAATRPSPHKPGQCAGFQGLPEPAAAGHRPAVPSSVPLLTPAGGGAPGAAAPAEWWPASGTQAVMLAKVLQPEDMVSGYFHLPACAVGWVPRLAAHSVLHSSLGAPKPWDFTAAVPHGMSCQLQLRVDLVTRSNGEKVPSYSLHNTQSLLGRLCGSTPLGQGTAFAVFCCGRDEYRLEWGTPLAANAVKLLGSTLINLGGVLVPAAGPHGEAAIAAMAAARRGAAVERGAAASNMLSMPTSSSAVMAAGGAYGPPVGPASPATAAAGAAVAAPRLPLSPALQPPQQAPFQALPVAATGSHVSSVLPPSPPQAVPAAAAAAAWRTPAAQSAGPDASQQAALPTPDAAAEGGVNVPEFTAFLNYMRQVATAQEPLQAPNQLPPQQQGGATNATLTAAGSSAGGNPAASEAASALAAAAITMPRKPPPANLPSVLAPAGGAHGSAPHMSSSTQQQPGPALPRPGNAAARAAPGFAAAPGGGSPAGAWPPGGGVAVAVRLDAAWFAGRGAGGGHGGELIRTGVTQQQRVQLPALPSQFAQQAPPGTVWGVPVDALHSPMAAAILQLQQGGAGAAARAHQLAGAAGVTQQEAQEQQVAAADGGVDAALLGSPAANQQAAPRRPPVAIAPAEDAPAAAAAYGYMNQQSGGQGLQAAAGLLPGRMPAAAAAALASCDPVSSGGAASSHLPTDSYVPDTSSLQPAASFRFMAPSAGGRGVTPGSPCSVSTQQQPAPERLSPGDLGPAVPAVAATPGWGSAAAGGAAGGQEVTGVELSARPVSTGAGRGDAACVQATYGTQQQHMAPPAAQGRLSQQAGPATGRGLLVEAPQSPPPPAAQQQQGLIGRSGGAVHPHPLPAAAEGGMAAAQQQGVVQQAAGAGRSAAAIQQVAGPNRDPAFANVLANLMDKFGRGEGLSRAQRLVPPQDGEAAAAATSPTLGSTGRGRGRSNAAPRGRSTAGGRGRSSPARASRGTAGGRGGGHAAPGSPGNAGGRGRGRRTAAAGRKGPGGGTSPPQEGLAPDAGTAPGLELLWAVLHGGGAPPGAQQPPEQQQGPQGGPDQGATATAEAAATGHDAAAGQQQGHGQEVEAAGTGGGVSGQLRAGTTAALDGVPHLPDVGGLE